MSLVWIVIASGSVLAYRDDATRHPSVQEVLSMTKGGVADEVMIERVRRLDAVPRLDAAAITFLMSKGVPDEVLLELARRRQTVDPCAIPERRLDVREVLDDPSIQRVLRRVEAGAATAEILQRVAREENVPVLDARALRRLTSKGVPSQVLLELVRKQDVRTTCDPVRAELLAAAGVDDGAAAGVESTERPVRAEPSTITATAGRVETAPRRGAAEPTSRGGIRVVAKSSLPVTYLEVLLDGDRVIDKGKMPEGEAEPGWTLAHPPVLDLKRGVVVFESELPAGSHQVETAFALTQIVETEWDAAVRAHGERYRTTRAGPQDPSGEVSICEIREGQVCVVLIRLVKRKDGYVVAYETKLE